MKKKNIIELEYNLSNEIKKQVIRSYTSKGKRFIAFAKHLLTYPFIWIWYNIRDWRTLICFLISFALLSSSVWGFYLAAFICGWNTDIAKWLISIGSAVWGWWLVGPGSPFTLLVILLTIGIKTLINKIRAYKSKNHKKV